ncbi:hypothetical protein BP5796_09588 [Coleophoma crateriformis]|uniref:Heterokaryon incompatibility domain-containing protein n=1 Tax=Coleophoma crateriformis TaxID=565419 RepID=A0A3D8QYH5_9HELO|nr:hypothetical protein BP5796_09588 [Coleophoma crateriformis]
MALAEYLDSDHADFDNNSKWPRRLLYVPSMTSYKWQPGNVYGGRKEPSYIALSYTWGRFQLGEKEFPQLQPLQIHGVPWEIPRINPETHFSVDEFETIIRGTMKTADRVYVFDEWKKERIRTKGLATRVKRQIGGFIERWRWEYEFLWLDIACIDQRKTSIQMAEIGRQARIFQNAKHAYAWLSTLVHTDLGILLSDLEMAVSGLQQEQYNQQRSGFDSRPWISKALQVLSDLTADPWFTSLWTLQEAFQCNHAIILSRDGKVSCDASLIVPRSWTLNQLFKLVNDLVMWTERTTSSRAEPEHTQLLTCIHETGLAALWYNNPMGLLGIANHRKCTKEEDRVYGIMQVFGSDVKVGKAKDKVDHQRTYSLPELEDELGDAILTLYPILSQMHVYLAAPALGKGWCVRGNSAVPSIVERGDMFGWNCGTRIETNIPIAAHSSCKLSTREMDGQVWGYLSGKACDFRALQAAWLDADQSDVSKRIQKSGWRMHRCSIQSIHMIALDRETCLGPPPERFEVLNVISVQDQKSQHDLASWIAERSRELTLRVFLLGSCDFGKESFNICMIVNKEQEGTNHYWRRVGICVWLTSHLMTGVVDHPLGPLLRGESDHWEQIEGWFG